MSDKHQEPDKTPGLVSWNELVSTDKVGSVQFYNQLFGWTTEDMEPAPGTTYTFFKQGDRPVGGLIPMPEEAKGAPTMWMGYITVANLRESVAKARSLGAKICKDITTLPMGSFAIVTDPQGATFGLWEFSDQGCQEEGAAE